MFEVGDISQCVILSSISDNICEYSECTFEYFMASLSTNDRHVFVAQPVTKIEIEEDITTLNCSEFKGSLLALYYFIVSITIDSYTILTHQTPL